MSESPVFFVVGSVRSGTTMLRLMLHHHPLLSCFGEFEYAIDLLTDPDSPPTGEEFACWLKTERRFNASGLKVDSRNHYSSIAKTMFREMSEQQNKDLAANGAALHRHFHRARWIWPECKFIYLYRDGRDVARSCAEMGWAGNVWAGCNFWERAEDEWSSLRRQLGKGDWLEVCNEDLVRNPVESLTNVCRFLGTHFDSQMLSYVEHSTYSAPNPALTDQWRRKLSMDELRQIEDRIGERLRVRGYQLGAESDQAVGSLERMWLRLGDRWGTLAFRARRYGIKLWFLDLLARRLPLPGLRERSQLALNEIDQSHLK